MLSNLAILWALVRRDYALQYAGSALGVAWVFIQNNVLILLYAAVFLGLGLRGAVEASGHFAYLLSGLAFWLPLNDLLLRGTSILSENRQLLRRAPVGADRLLWIPYIQYLIHSLITAAPVLLLLGWRGELRPIGVLFAWLVSVAAGLYLMLALHYLARANIVLKDLSPLIRLLTQLLFWSAPVLYRAEGWLATINEWNPLSAPLALYRQLLLVQQLGEVIWAPFLIYLALALFAFLVARRRLHSVALDHL